MGTALSSKRSAFGSGFRQWQRGASRTTLLLFVFLVVAGVYIGSQVIPFYYYYYEIENLMEAQAAKASVISDGKIRQTLLKKIKELNIPIEREDDLRINRVGGRIIIDLSYQEVLYIDLGDGRVYDLYVFDFNPHVEREF